MHLCESDDVKQHTVNGRHIFTDDVACERENLIHTVAVYTDHPFASEEAAFCLGVDRLPAHQTRLWILNGKNVKRKGSDVLENVANVLGLWHIFIHAAIKGKGVFYV